MTRTTKLALAAAACIALSGPALLAYDLSFRQSGMEARVHNVIKWLGFGLPEPDDPRLMQSTLVFLNTPLWLILLVLGSLLVGAIWSVILLNREPPKFR